MPPTLLIAPESSRDHRTPHGHPERVERFEAVLRALGSSGLSGRMQSRDCEEAGFDTLRLCHRADYIELVEREIGAGNRMLSTGDTHVGKGSLSAARMAVGAVCSAVDSVLTGPVKQAFCALRPPGHHARPQQGMGFCVFNNVAIGARHAIKGHGLQRVLIVDWDVHHGNGTQDIFYDDPSVLFFSTHQSPWYPGTGMRDETGEGAGADTTINCPFPAHTGRKEIFGAFRDRLLPAAEAFAPELVMISAGFDSRLGDPLGQFRLADGDFAELTNLLQDLADRHADGRLVSALEGGYSLAGLASSVESHVGALLG
ncbi:MAG: histone deacetylase [Acidobacteriia bacterium]|nr:histone deacetylase [Terriglobia bacterium]MYK08945.1 histone deacetylase [Terriglobia bacterium]